MEKKKERERERWKRSRSEDLASCGKPRDTLIGNHLCALCYMESLDENRSRGNR